MATAQTRMEWKIDQFVKQLNEVQKRTKKETSELVLRWSRTVVLKAAYNAPKRTGRLRAGFWPVGIALGMRTLYTTFPNQNEGFAIVQLEGSNPTIRFGNSVPYVFNPGGNGIMWFMSAFDSVRFRMQRELEETMNKAHR